MRPLNNLLTRPHDFRIGLFRGFFLYRFSAVSRPPRIAFAMVGRGHRDLWRRHVHAFWPCGSAVCDRTHRHGAHLHRLSVQHTRPAGAPCCAGCDRARYGFVIDMQQRNAVQKLRQRDLAYDRTVIFVYYI